MQRRSIRCIDEEVLLEGIRSGDPAMFKQLFDTYWEDLYAAAKYRLANGHEAEDMVQDIFLDIWQRRSALAIQVSIKTYLKQALKYKIIRSVAYDKVKKSSMMYLKSHMDMIEHSIIDVLQANEVALTIDRTVDQFPSNMQKVFKLRADQFSVSEIAEALGIAPQTVKNNTTEALRRLREVLAEKHPDVSSFFYLALFFLFTDY